MAVCPFEYLLDRDFRGASARAAMKCMRLHLAAFPISPDVVAFIAAIKAVNQLAVRNFTHGLFPAQMVASMHAAIDIGLPNFPIVCEILRFPGNRSRHPEPLVGLKHARKRT